MPQLSIREYCNCSLTGPGKRVPVLGSKPGSIYFRLGRTSDEKVRPVLAVLSFKELPLRWPISIA